MDIYNDKEYAAAAVDEDDGGIGRGSSLYRSFPRCRGQEDQKGQADGEESDDNKSLFSLDGEDREKET